MKEAGSQYALCESVVISCAYGYALTGRKAVVEIQFADFVSTGFTAVVNLLAKSYYRWGQPADVVIQYTVVAGASRALSFPVNEAWFTTVPGLKVVYPAFPNEAKDCCWLPWSTPFCSLNTKTLSQYDGIGRSGTTSNAIWKGVCRKEGAQLSIVPMDWGFTGRWK